MALVGGEYLFDGIVRGVWCRNRWQSGVVFSDWGEVGGGWMVVHMTSDGRSGLSVVVQAAARVATQLYNNIRGQKSARYIFYTWGIYTYGKVQAIPKLFSVVFYLSRCRYVCRSTRANLGFSSADGYRNAYRPPLGPDLAFGQRSSAP